MTMIRRALHASLLLAFFVLPMAGCGGSSSDAPADSTPADAATDAAEAGVAGDASDTADSMPAGYAAYTDAVASLATAAERGAAFLAANAEREGVTTTESGLQYEVVVQGDGEKPTAENTVEVHYEGTLIDGSIFDSSYQRGQTIAFPLGNVIAGWTEGLQHMPVGSTYMLYIPSALAYGSAGVGPIGPDETLVFKVQLVSIVG